MPYDPVAGVNTTLSGEITTYSFQCPVSATAGYWAAQNVPVWRYLYSAAFAESQPYPWMRAYHGSDLALFFQTEQRYAYQELGPEIEKAGSYLRGAVASFVRDPEEGLTQFGWPKYTGEGKRSDVLRAGV